jgi:hypothetical protein
MGLFRQLVVLDLLEAIVVAPVAVAPVRVTPRSSGRRMGSCQKRSGCQLVGLGIEQLQSWEVCPDPGLRKLGHKPLHNRCESLPDRQNKSH